MRRNAWHGGITLLLLLVPLQGTGDVPDTGSVGTPHGPEAVAQAESPIAVASPPFGDEPIHWAQAAGEVGAPLERVHEAVLDFASYPSMYSDIASGRIVRRMGPSSFIAFLGLKMPFPFEDIWAYFWVEDVPLGPGGRQVRASLIRGNVKSFFASWRITPVERSGGLSVRIQVDVRLVPDFPFPADGVNERLLRAARIMVQGLIRRATDFGLRAAGPRSDPNPAPNADTKAP